MHQFEAGAKMKTLGIGMLFRTVLKMLFWGFFPFFFLLNNSKIFFFHHHQLFIFKWNRNVSADWENCHVVLI